MAAVSTSGEHTNVREGFPPGVVKSLICGCLQIAYIGIVAFAHLEFQFLYGIEFFDELSQNSPVYPGISPSFSSDFLRNFNSQNKNHQEPQF
jgi:hypothetical protein